jgi:phage terminase large subunit-like protein
MAASTAQAAQAFNFVEGIFRASPHLAELVESVTADTIALSTSVDVTIRPASFRTIRGITAVAAICDEIGFWRSDDTANPDTEILRSLRPALATTGGMLACISSSTIHSNDTMGLVVIREYWSHGRQA